MIIRAMTAADVEPVARIFMDTWEMDTYGQDIALPSSVWYVRSAMDHSAFSYVAEVDGEVAGCVIGSTDTSRVPLEDIREALRGSLGHLDGYAVVESDVMIMEAADERLLESSGGGFDCQLSLLIVSEGMRGRGIGSALYRRAIEEFTSMGCRRMFLFTDDDCGYSFYDSDGCERLAETSVRIAFEDLLMMIYAKDLVAEQP